MSRRRRIMLAVLALLGGFAVWVFWPESAAMEVAGLEPPPGAFDVVILRDEYGIPHVRGRTDADAAYGLSWAHAEDDFATLQQTLLAARGDLATVYGPDAAPVDYLVALLRVRETAEAGWETLAPDTRALLDAYAAGVNHYAAAHPGESLPGLFPVNGRDVVAGFVQKAPLFYGIDEVLTGLFSEERPDLSASLGPAARFGSNLFAVSPRRSAGGETVLVSNSHQPWTGPVAWYEAHVYSEEGWDMTGALFPGMPVLALGHNRRLGWSFTVNRPDLVDVYLLETNPDDPDQYRLDGRWVDFEIEQAPIEVRLAGRLRWTFRREVVWSEFGPVVRVPHGTYAVRYAGMGLAGMVEQLYRMNRAETFEEWRAALESQSGLPSFNIGYADETGRIAYVHHGLFPDRAEGVDWSGYVDGTRRDLIWDRYLPLEALPWVVDPASGFVQSANSTPFTATAGPEAPDPGDFPASMGVVATETNRSLRLFDLLSADAELTPEEVLAIKYDVAYDPSTFPALLRDRIAAVQPGGDPALAAAVEAAAGWDLTVAEDSRGAAIVIGTIAELLAAGVELDPSQFGKEIVVGGGELRAAVSAAAAKLIDAHGRVDPRWGEANRLVRGDLDLAIAGGPDAVRAVYGAWEDGRFEGIAGDAYVLAVVWQPDGRVESSSIHQFGSATVDPSSPHFADQAPLFARRELKPVWFEEADIRAHLEREYRPGA